MSESEASSPEAGANAGGRTGGSEAAGSPPSGAYHPPRPAPGAVDELLADPIVAAKRIQVGAGAALYEPDTPASDLFYIHEGQVRIFQLELNSTRLVEILGSGDWFGFPALAGTWRYGMRAVAVTAATVSHAPADHVMSIVPQRPAMAAELIAQLARKLHAAYDLAANLVFDDTNSRLIKTLLQFSRSAAARPLEGEEGVELRITHQQLAQAVGAAGDREPGADPVAAEEPLANRPQPTVVQPWRP